MTKPVYLLDGEVLPPLAKDGFTFSFEPIWSQNAGRSTSTGEMVGDIVAVKYTARLTFNRLSAEEFASVFAIVSSSEAFHTLEFPHPSAPNVRKTIRCYFAPTGASFQAWYAADRTGYYDGLTLECIEK